MQNRLTIDYSNKIELADAIKLASRILDTYDGESSSSGFSSVIGPYILEENVMDESIDIVNSKGECVISILVEEMF